MFRKGDYIVYGSTGVCEVLDVTTMQMDGIPDDKLYYVLRPYQKKESEIFTPVEIYGRSRETSFLLWKQKNCWRAFLLWKNFRFRSENSGKTATKNVFEAAAAEICFGL